MNFKPCLLIPVYNHGPLIAATLARLKSFDLQCLIVDDGSDADTTMVLHALVEGESWLTLFRQTPNQGKGVAVLRGIAEARRLGFSHALQLDADGQHALEDIPALLAMARLAPEALISAAPIYDDTVPRSRLYGRYITHIWVWVETLSFSIIDSMCGFRVYPVAASDDLASVQSIGRRMDFDTDIMVRLYWRGVPVEFLRSKVSYPPNGISHFSPWADNLRISYMHTRLVCGMLLRLPMLLGRKLNRGKKVLKGSHWSQLRESGAYGGMVLGVACYKLLGRQGMRLLLYPIIGYFFLRNGQARRTSREFLARVYRFQLNSDSGSQQPAGYFLRPPGLLESFRHFMKFGRSVIDRIGSWSGDIKRDDAVFVGRQQLLDCIESGRGGILLTSHLGNAEMFRALVDKVAGVKMNVLVFNDNAAQINRLMKRLNPRADLELIQISTVDPGTAMMLNEKVTNGEFLVVAADRTSPTAPEKSMLAPFLGQKAAFPQGVFILAGLLDCPVFLLFCLEQGKHHFYLEHFADSMPIPRRQRATLLQGYIERYAQRLQHYVLMAPDQWFNFFDFWALPESPELGLPAQAIKNEEPVAGGNTGMDNY